jgi:hypothetical protein
MDATARALATAAAPVSSHLETIKYSNHRFRDMPGRMPATPVSPGNASMQTGPVPAGGANLVAAPGARACVPAPVTGPL